MGSAVVQPDRQSHFLLAVSMELEGLRQSGLVIECTSIHPEGMDCLRPKLELLSIRVAKMHRTENFPEPIGLVADHHTSAKDCSPVVASDWVAFAAAFAVRPAEPDMPVLLNQTGPMWIDRHP